MSSSPLRSRFGELLEWVWNSTDALWNPSESSPKVNQLLVAHRLQFLTEFSELNFCGFKCKHAGILQAND